MSKEKKETFFWASYSDLMTSLFFVMLVLFVLSVATLYKQVRRTLEEKKATEVQLRKIEEIENAVKNIDTKYFIYNSTHKKHILKIKVHFPKGVSDIGSLSELTIDSLVSAGQSIKEFLDELNIDYPNIKYLLIIEGQASKDGYPLNFQLSYERALGLKRLWDDKNIKFGENCEVIISGSGTEGTLREKDEKLNQRFLIHIIPKPGIIENKK